MNTVKYQSVTKITKIFQSCVSVNEFYFTFNNLFATVG